MREGFEPVDNREFMDEDTDEDVGENAFGEEEPSKGKPPHIPTLIHFHQNRCPHYGDYLTIWLMLKSV